MTLLPKSFFADLNSENFRQNKAAIRNIFEKPLTGRLEDIQRKLTDFVFNRDTKSYERLDLPESEFAIYKNLGHWMAFDPRTEEPCYFNDVITYEINTDEDQDEWVSMVLTNSFGSQIEIYNTEYVDRQEVEMDDES